MRSFLLLLYSVVNEWGPIQEKRKLQHVVHLLLCWLSLLLKNYFLVVIFGKELIDRKQCKVHRKTEYYWTQAYITEETMISMALCVSLLDTNLTNNLKVLNNLTNNLEV